MPRKSTRENKTIYQKSRENAGFTREAAASEMSFITADRIENIETEKTSAQPEDVLEMAKAYKDPLLPNAYCSTCCPIGKKYVPQLTEKALSQITLEILQSVNALYEEKNQLISITVDGEISENEMEDFARIQGQLKTLSAAADTLQIWLEKRLMG